MPRPDETSARVWLGALKPASWPKLLVPMVLGQAIGFAAAGHVGAGAMLFGVLFTVLDAVFIVLLNDWADRDVDALKRRLFPGAGSPKTIPDGLLRAEPVLLVAVASGALALLTAGLAGPFLGRPLLGSAAAVCLLLFVAYSLPPIRLNYRGGGEVLEAAGVGLALPWLQAYALSGQVSPAGLPWLVGFSLLSLGGAVASGLSDEESDRAGGKRTLASVLGNRAARRVVEACVVLGIVAWLSTPLVEASRAALLTGLAGAGVAALLGWKLRSSSSAAVTGAWDAQRTYKAHLHRAIWGGALAVAAGLVVGSLSAT